MTGVIVGFMALISLGTFLLSLPNAREPGMEWDFWSTLFTATSAVCVTGLVVVDTGTYWSPFGQAVILGLIQAGGLGVMTASMLILMVLRRAIAFRDRFELYESSRAGGLRSVKGLIWLTILISLVFELLGAAAIWYRLRPIEGGEGALWPSLFHAVSAFNNAGFDIMKGFASLSGFARDRVFLLIIGVLVVSGGLGILVLLDMASKRSWRPLSPNSKMVLLVSAFLLAVGFSGILAAEFTNPSTLGGMALPDKLANALFHSVTARTAGFNSLPVEAFHDETLFLTMALMYIGGATGSTAGGIKVNTFGVLLLATMAAARGYEQTSAFGRQFSHRLVYRAVAVVTMSLGMVFVGTLVLTVTEGFAFSQTLFEVFSAFGTVGLTTGITPELSVAGKVNIIVLMFVGRLGPLTLAYALAQRARKPRYALPEEDIAIG